MPIEAARARFVALAAIALCLANHPATAKDLKLSLAGDKPEIVFNARTDGCAPIDTPDIDPRAFRDSHGNVVMYTLHYINRALRGPDLSHLKIDCSVALNSSNDPDPAHYDDRRYLTATWTDDGENVVAIVHHEYHADDHNRCSVKQSLGCWYNTLVSFSSSDGGRGFKPDKPIVVAAAPFKQDVEQGRHRGFFNPSNIVSDGRYKYFMASTTGWSGQPYGVCLFRSPNPRESASWRAWDGKDFSIHYADPYGAPAPPPRPCAIVQPFVFPVGSIARYRANGEWIAVWMAKKDDKDFPVSGFYTATSADLKTWSQPRLLVAGTTIHDGACGGTIIGYPSLIDEHATSRNFEDVGDQPWLYYVTMAMNGCETGNRMLIREKVKIAGVAAAREYRAMTEAIQSGDRRRLAAPRISADRVVNFFFVIFILRGAIALIEPSPYDFASMIAIPVWFVMGFRIHRMFIPFAALICIYNLGGFIALIPYWNEPDPVLFMLQSLYLLITSLFFAIFFGERTLERAELCLMAFTASNVIAASAAIAGYLDIGGSSAIFMVYDRASGTFKDPNVLGSFLIMGALYCMQLVMLNRTRHIFGVMLVLLVLIAGIFLSFSRGSWGALMVATALMVGLTFITTDSPRLRRRILIWAAVAIVAVALLVAALMSIDSIRELVLQRSQGVGEEYDDRRFFNQLRSLPMLVELPLGFGPLQFHDVFGLEPHSSFVNSFASYGWLGGFAFLILVGATIFIGFRLCWVKSPYRTLAQVYWPSLFVFLLQGFQIDIDHWRHVLLMFGAVWGIEAGRQRWLEAGSVWGDRSNASVVAPRSIAKASR